MHSLFFFFFFSESSCEKNLFNYLNASYSFKSSHAKGNLFKKKYVQKKHFVLEHENNCEEEISLTPHDRIDNVDWFKCADIC